MISTKFRISTLRPGKYSKLVCHVSNTLSSFSCCNKYIFSNISLPLHAVELEIYHRCKLKDSSNIKSSLLLQTIHSHGHRYLRRRPIDVAHQEIRGTTLDEYVQEATRQSGDEDTHVANGNPSQKGEKLKDCYTIPMVKNHQSKDKLLKDNIREGQSRLSSHDYKRKDQQPKIKKPLAETVNVSEESEIRGSFKFLNFKHYSEGSKHTKLLLHYGNSHKLRIKNDIFLVDGWRLLAEAMHAELKPKAIFFSRQSIFQNMIPMIAKNNEELVNYLNLLPLYKTPYDTFKTWSSLVTPPGIIGAFSLSEAMLLCSKPRENSIPITVILDQVRDPSNVGSILRTLASAGVQKILMMKGCCDLWEPKVIRSASGAHFHIHCETRVPWSSVETHVPRSSSVYLAEASGLSEGEDKSSENSLTEKESYAALDRLREISLEESEKQYTHEDDPETGERVFHNESFNDLDHLKLFEDAPLIQHLYDDMRFSYNDNGDISPVVLILGGETGLSNCAKKFAVENEGVNLCIPMLNNVESLNSAVATGIIVYEMQRQYKEQNRSIHDRAKVENTDA